MSPGPGEQNSRVGTPHDNNQNFMQQPNFNQGFNPQQFAQNMNAAGQMGMNPMNMAQQQMQHHGMNAAQRTYQMQMQAQARQLHAQAQARNTNGMPPNMPQGMPNQQMNHQPNMPTVKSNSAEEFVKGLQAFMAAQGRTVDLYPHICQRQVPLLRIYMLVMKAGGSLRTTKANLWGQVAQSCGFPPQQQMQAAQEMQHYWMANLAPFEAAWFRQRQQMAAQNQVQNQNMPGQPNQDQGTPNHQRSQSDIMSMKLNGQMPSHNQTPSINGFTPANHQESTPSGQHRSSLSRQLDSQQLNGMQGPSPQKRPQSGALKPEPEPESTMPVRKPIEDPFKPDIMPPSRYHGPINVEEMYIVGQQILDHKPVVPTLRELGVIDIHALTMAIKSGMHGETRVALDTLVTLSTEPTLQLSLVDCEDLMDTLIDYAQTQVEFLGEHSVEVTDEMSLSPYEDVVRACRAEAESLQDVPEFGSLAYDLDRAADRLICVTTLIRNFSFYEANFGVLGQTEVLQLLINVIQQLGMKEMPLRTNRNTLDFMKDVIIYLSNLSTSLNLPGKQEALSILHFLLAFAPTPSPALPNAEKVSFTMYNPNLHKYMPSAVDSLAKLLARDEPNRMYYKSIFAADAHSNPPYELLSRTFGLAIAPIPPSGSGPGHTQAIIEARKPFLLQGMLAAEILATLAPGSEHSLARTWLESDDGFSGSLLRLVSLLSSTVKAQRPPPPQPGRGMPPQHEPDANAYGAITNRAMAVLKILVHKAKLVDTTGTVVLPYHISLKRESLLGAMIHKDMDSTILRQLCAYAGLED